MQLNRITPPLYFLLFGRKLTGEGISTAPISVEVAEGGEWHLLYHDIVKDGALLYESSATTRGPAAASPHTGGGGGVPALRKLLAGLPEALHPCHGIEWCSVVQGEVYQHLQLLSEESFTTTIARRVGSVFMNHLSSWGQLLGTTAGSADASVAAYLVQDAELRRKLFFVREAASSSSGETREQWVVSEATAHDGELSSPISTFVKTSVEPAVQWLTKERASESTEDASVPSLTAAGFQLLFPLLSFLSPLLSTSLFVESNAAGEVSTSASFVDPNTVSGLARWKAERDAGIAQWKERVGAYTTFSVPRDGREADHAAPSGDTLTYSHVLLLQRPLADGKPVDVESREVGPLAPQPATAELHLFRDRGDVLYTLEQLQNRSLVRFVFEDTIQEDGELFVQLVPVEGTPFDDLEAFFAAISANKKASGTADGAAVERRWPTASRWNGSCSSMLFPRVIFRTPTGRAAKENPIAHAQSELRLTSPTSEMLHAAAAALQFLSQHIIALLDGATASPEGAEGEEGIKPAISNARPCAGYTLNLPPVDMQSLSEQRCGWCGRRREKLLRCTACKAVWYCCAAHQALDWAEGSHKTKCKLWRRERAIQETVIAPLAAEMSTGSTCSVVRDAGWSYAASLVRFLHNIYSNGLNLTSSSRRYFFVHVVGMAANQTDSFLSALTKDSDLTAMLCAVVCRRQSASSTHAPGESPLLTQLRITVCSEDFTETQRNEVWAVCLDGDDGRLKVYKTATTGVLGDEWHDSGDGGSAVVARGAIGLIRLYATKYHFLQRSDGNARERLGPDAVLSFGPLTGEGLSFLSGAVDTIASNDVGIIPLRWVETSYVGAIQTRDAVVARVSNSDSCTTLVKNRMSALLAEVRLSEKNLAMDSFTSAAEPLGIRVNRSGLCPLKSSDNFESSDRADGNTANVCHTLPKQCVSRAIPRYLNAYFFDLPASLEGGLAPALVSS